MSLIIKPPDGAVPVYPWMLVQDFYKGVLEKVAVAQKAFEPDYGFEVFKNRIRPRITETGLTQLVNIMIGERKDTAATRHDKDVEISFDFELHVNASDEDNDQAGEIVVERAHYFAAVIEDAVTSLFNDPFFSPDAEAIPGVDVRGVEVTFADIEDVRKAEEIFMFGIVRLNVIFSKSNNDWDLKNLETLRAVIDGREYSFSANA
jgi:hypothetical protein